MGDIFWQISLSMLNTHLSFFQGQTQGIIFSRDRSDYCSNMLGFEVLCGDLPDQNHLASGIAGLNVVPLGVLTLLDILICFHELLRKIT